MDKDTLTKLLEEKVKKFNYLQKEVLMTAGEIRLLNYLIKPETPKKAEEAKSKEEEVV